MQRHLTMLCSQIDKVKVYGGGRRSDKETNIIFLLGFLAGRYTRTQTTWHQAEREKHLVVKDAHLERNMEENTMHANNHGAISPLNYSSN